MSVVTLSDAKELARCNSLGAKETDFVGRKGYWRKDRGLGDGSYDWGFRFKQNEHGKKTKTALEVEERMAPSFAAHTARHLSKPLPVRAAMRDRDGGVRLVDPALAEKTAAANGWGHHWRAGGIRVESGVDGELWREYPNGDREPTGRWCLGTPAAWQRPPFDGNPDGTMKPWSGETYDPEGNMWAMVDGDPKMVEANE